MPELPEIEVSRMGISPHLTDQKIKQIVIRQSKLRWPVSEELKTLSGVRIDRVSRQSQVSAARNRVGEYCGASRDVWLATSAGARSRAWQA